MRVIDIAYYALSIVVLGLLLFTAVGCASTQPPPLVAALQEQMQATYRPIVQDGNTDVAQIHMVLSPWSGDCDDYALSAVSYLRAMGYPARTEIVSADGVLHLVATYDDWVLDNLHSRVVTRDQAGYWQ